MAEVTATQRQGTLQSEIQPVRSPRPRHARVDLREVGSFLAVGGTGYVADVAAFTLLRTTGPLAHADPIIARVLAVAVAMVVTYVGNATFTWRGNNGERAPRGRKGRTGQVALFVVVNVIALGLSVACLWISHDVLGFTSILDDNVSANVVGLALGTQFRFWAYRTLVFDGGGVG